MTGEVRAAKRAAGVGKKIRWLNVSGGLVQNISRPGPVHPRSSREATQKSSPAGDSAGFSPKTNRSDSKVGDDLASSVCRASLPRRGRRYPIVIR